MRWVDLPIEKGWFANVREGVLTQSAAAMENLYVNEAGGHTPFPPLYKWLQLPSPGDVVPFSWDGGMVAVTDKGRVFRVSSDRTARDVTGVPLGGGSRPVVARTDESLLLAAGGPILVLADKTEILSADAPETTHVVYLEGYVVAPEPRSGRFFRSDVGDYRTWNPINQQSAEGKPDPITCMAVNEFNEMVVAGPESIELYQTVANADVPFYKRADLGEGILAPHTLCEGDGYWWCVNRRHEMTRIASMSPRPVSRDIDRLLMQSNDLSAVNTWDGAWAQELLIHGQRFIVLQVPRMRTEDGREGPTFLYDYRNGRWSSLWGVDGDGRLERWPGRGFATAWNKQFVGGPDGWIYILGDPVAGFGDLEPVERRMRFRSGTYNAQDLERGAYSLEIDNVRMRMARTKAVYGDVTDAIRLRAELDGQVWTDWVTRPLEGTGHHNVEFTSFGVVQTVAFEYEFWSTEAIESVSMQAHMQGYAS